MLLKFKLENFKSYLEEQVFTMERSSDRILDKHIIGNQDNEGLKFSAIYGANASGKTNLLEAIQYFQYLVTTSKMLEVNDSLLYEPHKLSPNKGTTLGLLFLKNNIKYYYEVKLNSKNIIDEKLYYYKDRQNTIFERTDTSNIKINRAFETEFTQMVDKTLDNKLFLTTIAAWSDNEHIKNVTQFIKEDLIVITKFDNSSLLEYTSSLYSEGNKKFKNKFLKVFKDFGLKNLQDINVQINEKDILDEERSNLIPSRIQSIFGGVEQVLRNNSTKGSNSKKFDIKFKYAYEDHQYFIDLYNESRGVMKLYELLGMLFTIIKEDKVLFIDEIECSIHPMVLNEILELFTQESSHSQLVFTTHNEMFLDLSKLRRDEIWFVERENNITSQLYSLWDIKGVRKNENIKLGYYNKRYGAHPDVDFKDILVSEKDGSQNE